MSPCLPSKYAEEEPDVPNPYRMRDDAQRQESKYSSGSLDEGSWVNGPVELAFSDNNAIDATFAGKKVEKTIDGSRVMSCKGFAMYIERDGIGGIEFIHSEPTCHMQPHSKRALGFVFVG